MIEIAAITLPLLQLIAQLGSNSPSTREEQTRNFFTMPLIEVRLFIKLSRGGSSERHWSARGKRNNKSRLTGKGSAGRHSRPVQLRSPGRPGPERRADGRTDGGKDGRRGERKEDEGRRTTAEGDGPGGQRTRRALIKRAIGFPFKT